MKASRIQGPVQSEIDDRAAEAGALMNAFVKRTGLSDRSAVPRRYLWTDAFAVCNLLELGRRSGNDTERELGIALIDQTHTVLGRHRPADSRKGWISGLDERSGQLHPTAGGLRIGKSLNERGPNEPLDPREEWDRDGQYFHYLTKWMHALHQASRATGNPVYLHWAMEMGRTILPKFAYRAGPDGPWRMYWKMSIDLSRPLVASMGHHDPLDGLVAYGEVQRLAAELQGGGPGAGLSEEIAILGSMCRDTNWDTDDPLSIGSLLCDCYRVVQISMTDGPFPPALLPAMLASVVRGLRAFVATDPMSDPVDRRLGFRELGLTIGLHALERLEILLSAQRHRIPDAATTARQVEQLRPFLPLRAILERFWTRSDTQESRNWLAHRDINEVMLATCLLPDGFLELDWERSETR